VKIFRSLSEVPPEFGPSAITIGKFDGVHAGHRAVIAKLRHVASALHLESVAVTFDRNPLSLLAPDRCPDDLISTSQKLEAIEGTGLDAVLVLTFDKALSDLSPREFVTSILVDALHAAVVLVGADFRFGAKGAGTVETLRELGATFGFEVQVIDDVTPNGAKRVSSTWIRELLTEGRVVEAADLLGALPSIRAQVVHGLERGRKLGYPTANLSREVEGFIPADGVYAAWLTVHSVRYAAAVSIGNNPTFDDVGEKQVEAHILDQTLDLYDEVVELSFVEYVRGMRKFSGPEALADQMGIDEAWIRDVLGVPKRPRAEPGEPVEP
jgi:riboflavin kinase/FMN adenylyltransferase